MENWTYITTCRDLYMDDWGDSAITSEYVSDDKLILFSTQDEAFKAACKSAEDEVDLLNTGCDEDRSFGVPEDDEYECMNEVKVYCYFEEDNTELVTRRTIRQISSNTKTKHRIHGKSWN